MSAPSVISSVSPRTAPVVIAVLAVSLALAGPVEAGISKPFKPSATIELSPGISYSKGTMRTAGTLIQSVRVATVWPADPSVRLRSLLSNDKVIRRELPTRMARRKSGPGMVAMVATNGDMSTAQRMDAYAAPQSMAVSGGELLVAQACTRPTLGIDSAGGARIDDVRVHLTMSLPGRKVTKQVHRVNTHRDDGSTVLFTSRFARSTKTAPGGVEVVLSLPDVLRPNGMQEVRVLEVRRGAGNTPLEPGKAVLSVKSSRNDWVRDLRAGDRMRLETSVVRNVDKRCGGRLDLAQGWGDLVEAVGGNHFTVRNGAVAAPSRQLYAPGSQRHPRTNVGVTADGRVLMVTVDGRQPGYSTGVKLAEMGRLMTSLGAVEAFNLDGGGSTMMGRRFPGGAFRVTNRPSDGRERLATQALVAFQFTPSP
jgi:large repetitive protein